jgi:TetR/AcrR family transcriptional regulator, regulator of mycofactocin system
VIGVTNECREANDTQCQQARPGQDGPVTETETAPAGAPTEGTRARVERAALDLFTLRGFENVTTDEVADSAGISRRTFFRYYATKADAVWGDFAGHVARLAARLAVSDPAQPVLASVCAAYVEANDYGEAELPLLRERMQLILTEPALLAHSQLRFAEVDRAVARHVAARTGASPADLVPRLVAATTRAAATTAFEAWLADERSSLGRQLHLAFDEITDGFPSLRR